MMLAPHRVGRLRGYSLVEMIVVLALVASFLAIALPAVFRPLAKAELREAAKQMQAALLDARTRAVESGVVQEFRYQPGGSRYEIRAHGQADQGGPSAVSNPAAAATAGQPAQSAALEPVAEDLPEGIVFADPQEEQRAEPFQPLATASAPAVDESATGEKWITLLRLYPNGRSLNCRLKLRGSKSWSVELMLRGLTGTVFVGEPRQEETEEKGSPRKSWSPDRVSDSR
jgi:prepilin-type N-terminal cleavage/methylation domain-containing protein